MIDETGTVAYAGAVRCAADRPDQFWIEAARAIDWVANPPRAHDQGMGRFPEGILNTCHNCLDRHVQAGRGDALALAYDSPVTETIRHYTYRELDRAPS